MSFYRCFVVDRDGKIRAAEVLECRDDAEISRRAAILFSQHAGAHTIEIWQLDRRLGVLTQSRSCLS